MLIESICFHVASDSKSFLVVVLFVVVVVVVVLVVLAVVLVIIIIIIIIISVTISLYYSTHGHFTLPTMSSFMLESSA